MRSFRKWTKTRNSFVRENYVSASLRAEEVIRKCKIESWMKIARRSWKQKVTFNMAKSYRGGNTTAAWIVPDKNVQSLLVEEEVAGQ